MKKVLPQRVAIEVTEIGDNVIEMTLPLKDPRFPQKVTVSSMQEAFDEARRRLGEGNFYILS